MAGQGAPMVFQMNPNCGNPNRVFKKEYDLREELGRGGFGTVRRCVEKRTKKEYAVKYNNAPDKKTAQTEEYNISRVLCNPVGHENIVNLYDSIEEVDTRFNIYEIASGGDVMENIKAREFYTPEDAAELFYGLLGGVEHIHSSWSFTAT